MELRKEKEAPAATTFLSPQMIFLTLISRQLLDIFLWNKPAKYVYLKIKPVSLRWKLLPSSKDQGE